MFAYLNAIAHGHRDFFAIFLSYRPRFVRNEDVMDLDTSFERFDVCVIRDYTSQTSVEIYGKQTVWLTIPLLVLKLKTLSNRKEERKAHSVP